jgi:adenosylcobinamide kinase / adenosylcobinamide-phosphate guanylyltransferase
VTVRAFVTGGARSGKSAFAEQLARDLGGESVLYVATAETPEGDSEMRRRVEEHRSRRPAGWSTFEISYSAPAASLSEAARAGCGAEAVLLDSLTLWVSGRMMAGTDEEILTELDGFLAAAAGLDAAVVVVADEVGLGLVPESREGRLFRDLLGLANQLVAAASEEVYLCISGIPLQVR